MNNKLKELLKEKNIIHLNYVDNWEKAVEIASEPLIKDGSIEKSYVDKMKESVIKNGTYMVLTDYFALMHARPEDGVNKMSMSLLTLNKPVNMEGKEVKIFLVLAAKDNSSHIEALSNITELLMDEDKFDIFLNGEKEEILELIN